MLLDFLPCVRGPLPHVIPFFSHAIRFFPMLLDLIPILLSFSNVFGFLPNTMLLSFLPCVCPSLLGVLGQYLIKQADRPEFA